MSNYREKDAAKETKVSKAYVKAAWHNAKNDAVGTHLQGRAVKKRDVTYDPKKHGKH